MPIPRASKALARFTVLDLSRVRAGPTCVRQLADWGANVIKIEAPPGIEESMGGPRERSDFQNLHRNKRSMTLNFKSPEGVAAFKRMVKKADVVVENFRPNVKKRLGIDYKTLARINPRLVYASISGFGQDGPYADRPGFDQIAQGMGGLMSITGPAGQGPFRVGIPVADLSAGLFAALGILVALLEREKSGKGQAVETSLLQAQIFMLDFQAARYLVEGRSGEAGRQQSSDQHSDRSVQDPRRLHQHCHQQRQDVGNASAARSGRMRCCKIRTTRPTPGVRRTAMRSTPRSRAIWRAAPVTNGSNGSTRPACRAGRSIPSTRCSPIRRCSISVSRRRVDGKKNEPFASSASRCRCRERGSRLVARPPKLGEHTDAVLKEFGFSARQIAALHKAKAV